MGYQKINQITADKISESKEVQRRGSTDRRNKNVRIAVLSVINTQL